MAGSQNRVSFMSFLNGNPGKSKMKLILYWPALGKRPVINILKIVFKFENDGLRNNS